MPDLVCVDLLALLALFVSYLACGMNFWSQVLVVFMARVWNESEAFPAVCMLNGSCPCHLITCEVTRHNAFVISDMNLGQFNMQNSWGVDWPSSLFERGRGDDEGVDTLTKICA